MDLWNKNCHENGVCLLIYGMESGVVS